MSNRKVELADGQATTLVEDADKTAVLPSSMAVATERPAADDTTVERPALRDAPARRPPERDSAARPPSGASAVGASVRPPSREVASRPAPAAAGQVLQADATTQVGDAVAPVAGASGGNLRLHHQLQTQLKELHLQSEAMAPEWRGLLRAVSAHYTAIDDERRGIVQSMRLMADEARALANEAHEQSSEHLQAILDHIKDVVITVNEEGVIQTFNPTGERVFGHAQAELVGQRIDLLIPGIAAHERVKQALQRLAANTGDTQQDLAGRESLGKRKNGEFFPAEIAVSRARVARREVFVLCLRDITERRESEQAIRESEARYRLLVNHAPEAIVVYDVDGGRYVDANENAEKYFALERAQLLQVNPLELSPPSQPDGVRSAERAREYIQRALDGEQLVHEWLYRDSAGKEIISEVRLVRLPSGGRRLLRASIADISERKRAERVA
ncbi:MAG: PAS domain S-box protein, partial [Sinobacteraceae bacterium]|nr:PAS domain S-box protein [Nevskiaceae bacterium]